MTNQEVIEIMRAEQNCVQRNISGKCNRDCAHCDLLQDDAAIITAFDHAIAALEKQEREKWHPIYPDDPKSFPDNDRLILVSFRNAPGIIDIARWRTDLDGGMFCPGDEDYPYTRSGMYVNAWKNRLEVYEEDDNE